MSDTTLCGASLLSMEEPAPAPEHSVNPCIDMYGPGPESSICRGCVHLHGFQQSTTSYKCAKRAWKTKGGKYPGTTYPGGDHRVRWPACAKFEEREETNE